MSPRGTRRSSSNFQMALAAPLILLFAAIGAPAAHASTIVFTIGGSDTGLLTITETSGLISAISGTFDGSTIGALIPPLGDPGGGFGGDDDVYTGVSPYFDSSGVSFTLDTPDDAHGDIYVNISDASNGPGTFGTCEWNTTSGCNGVVGNGGLDTITLDSIVPEPNTGFLMLAAACIGIAMRKRIRSSAEMRGAPYSK